MVIRFFLTGLCRYRGDKICTVHVEISTALNSHFTHDGPRLASNIPQTNDCFEGNIMPSDSTIGKKILEICIVLWSRITPFRACTSCLANQHFDFNSTDILVLLQAVRELQLIFANNGKGFFKTALFSRYSWGRNTWRTPKNVYLGGHRIVRCYKVCSFVVNNRELTRSFFGFLRNYR